ncbi:MAG: hypothetical protein Q8N96_13425 [Methylovulum sp.]|nr:hypothetical protein [Methylovulum sp.]
MKCFEYSQPNSFGFGVKALETSAYPITNAVSSNSLIDAPLIYQDGNNTSKFQIECFKDIDFWFSSVSSSSSKLKDYYLIQENEFTEVIRFVSRHNTINFLLLAHQPIVDIFGNIQKTLHLFKCWDEETYHLVLTICSHLDDMDEMMALEERLFERLESYPATDDALHYIVISQD